MAKYLFIYHGGSAPSSQEEGQKMIQEWMQWLSGLGASVIDGGNPVGDSVTVNADGSVTDNGGANPVSGYGIFSAASAEEAAAHAKGCPILAYGGSVELAEIHEV